MTIQSSISEVKPIKVTKRKIIRDMSKCMLCGRCSNVCPASCTKFTVAERGLCTHCNLCAEICPVKAIDSYESNIPAQEVGQHYTKMQSYSNRKMKINCVMCMECYERCPMGAISIDNGKMKISKGDAGASIINCSLCTLCVRSCPTGVFKYEMGRIRMSPDLCVLCGECVRVCPTKTMRLKERYPEGFCVMCGRCVKSCPVGALTIKVMSWDGSILDSCVRCGTCSRVCPAGAITFNPITDKKPVVDVSKCILCEICASDCPVEALPIKCNLTSRRLVEHRINVNRDLCIGCGLCVEACKVTLKGESAPYLKDGLAHIDNAKCIGCGACATTCPTECIRVVKVFDDSAISGRADRVVVFP